MSGEITVTFDTQPFSDSFLPRYLTVRLLKILATTIKKTERTQDCINLINNNQKFIKRFKSNNLFTPLTYSIFWQEDVEKILEDYADPLDTSDKYNCTALALAIANEEFALACELLNKGATLLVEDKLVLEIALISIMQRDEELKKKIFSEKNNIESWMLEYLEYLNSYITEKTTKKISNYHEIMNIPMRTFGQVLNTPTFFNGIPSYFGFLGPAIDTLTIHLHTYANNVTDENIKILFAKIAKAFDMTKNTCKYFGNIPTASDAAQTLTTKILDNIKNAQNDAVILFGGWAGNAVTIAFINKILIYSNLGTGSNPDATTQFFNIINISSINTQMVNTFINGLGYATAPEEILALLGSIVEINPLFSIKQSAAAIDNCVFINPRAIVQGLLFVLNAYEKNKVIDTKSLATTSADMATIYNKYIDSLHKQTAMDLANVMRNKQLSQNTRIECCALALNYINQHYTDPEALTCCMELKNALEFAGLTTFYVSAVDPQAKNAILAMTITQQENTAIEVAAKKIAGISNKKA